MKKDNYKNIQYFLVPYIIFALGLLLLILFVPKEELHLMMTRHRSPAADWFFRIWTELGGFIPFVIVLIVMFYRYSASLFLLTSQLTGLLIALIVKNIFRSPRPSLYFKEFYPEILLPVVPGFDLMTYNSFPSGHTVNAFALFFCLALIIKNKWIKLLCFVVAALVGYSRIYLSQHFAIDVLPGSLIGVISAWMIYPYYQKLNRKWKKNSLADYFTRKKESQYDDNSK